MNTILMNGLAITFAVSAACTSGTPSNNTAEQNGSVEKTATVQAPPQLKDEKARTVYEHYIHLKTALINADVKEAKAGAAALRTALSNAGDGKSASIASKIATAADIKTQRDNFGALAAGVESIVKGSGLKSGTIYKQYCPMADAYWLANESDIKNPYYGNDMLTCGEVKEEIK